MARIVIFDHPLIKHKLSFIRDMNTGSKEFRELVTEISMLVAYEATRDFPLMEVEIETPMQKMTTEILQGKKVGLVPILRAGLGMVEGFLKIIPAAKIGHIGLYRDHDTLQPVEYFCKMPQDVDERDLIVLDPMLATGGTVVAAVDMLKKRNPRSIRVVSLIAAPEGMKNVKEHHPDIDIYVAALDEKLDKNGYILPGLGDAGDRLFGTK
ncbi:MAG: uracil phosphoribosyltransferase [Tissierellia bacterium]|nr:uracil phosphoribosyltransferase [Tissierellia bacterium]